MSHDRNLLKLRTKTALLFFDDRALYTSNFSRNTFELQQVNPEVTDQMVETIFHHRESSTNSLKNNWKHFVNIFEVKDDTAKLLLHQYSEELSKNNSEKHSMNIFKVKDKYENRYH